MTYIPYNKNPYNKSVTDCPIRAISTVTDADWDTVYIGIVVEGFTQKDMPNSNNVWGSYLKKLGYTREVIPNFCPDCYTVSDFCSDHPTGRYVLACNGHTVAAINGDYYDTFDSGDMIPLYYWFKGEN